MRGGTLQIIHNTNYFIVKINFGPPPLGFPSYAPGGGSERGKGRKAEIIGRRKGRRGGEGVTESYPPPTSIHPSCPPHASHQLDFTGSSQRKEGREAREGKGRRGG